MSGDSHDEPSICPEWCVHKDAGLGYHRHRRRMAGEVVTTTPKPDRPPAGPSGVSPNMDGSR